MKRITNLGILSLVTSALLVGCGSDSNNREGEQRSNSNNIDSVQKVGHFIDSPVEGVSYKSSSGIEGSTDMTGRFYYQEGDTIRFSISNLLLGETTPDEEGLVTPQSLAQDDEALTTLLLRVLQSLDSDNNPDNGITIPSEVITSLSEINQTEISAVATEEQILNLDRSLSLAIDEDFDGIIDVSDTQAESHFELSMNSWQTGNRPTEETTQGHQNGGETHGSSQSSQTEGANTIDVSSLPISTLTPELKNAIAYMGNEERLAYDVYHNLYNYHIAESGIEIRQLKNISENSEITHVGIVQDLVNKYQLNPEDVTNVIDPVATREVAFEDMPSGHYDVPVIQSLYDVLYAKGVTTQQDALEVGCMVEVTDVEDLDRYIALAQESNASDVIDAFTVLRSGSYNHYWAFDKGLKNIGIEMGCCSLGTINEVNYCQPDYPQNEHDEGEASQTQDSDTGQGNTQGEGNAQGQGGGKGHGQS